MSATLARAAFANSRQGATGTLTISGTIADGETGVIAFLSNWDTALAVTAGGATHPIASITGGGAWALRQARQWNAFGTVWYRIEWWGTAPGAAVAASSVVVAFSGTNVPIVEGVTIFPVAGAVAFGTVAYNNGTSLLATVTLPNMLDNNNLMVGLLWGDDSATPMTAPYVGNPGAIMNPGAVSDFYSRAFDNTRATPGTLTCSGTWGTTSDWQAAAIELRSVGGIKRAKFVRTNSSQAVGATTIAAALSNIAPDSLVVLCFSFDTAGGTITVSTVRDDLAVDAALGKYFADPNFSQGFAIYFFKAYGGGDRTLTVTLSSSTPWRDLTVIEYLGAHLTTTKDGDAQQNSASNVTSFNTGNLSPSPSVSGELIVAHAEGTGGAAPAAVSPFTEVFAETAASHEGEDYVQPAAGAIAPAWTQASGPYSCVAVSFFPAPFTMPAVLQRKSRGRSVMQQRVA